MQQDEQDYTTTEDAARQRASLHHLRRCAGEEEAQLLCSLPDALSAKLSCALTLYFLLCRGKTGSAFQRVEKESKRSSANTILNLRSHDVRSLAAELDVL